MWEHYTQQLDAQGHVMSQAALQYEHSRYEQQRLHEREVGQLQHGLQEAGQGVGYWQGELRRLQGAFEVPEETEGLSAQRAEFRGLTEVSERFT